MRLRGPKPRRKEILWSPEFAYGIGLMASDGNLRGDGLHLSLVSKDREQIQHAKKCFGISAHESLSRSGRKDDPALYHRIQWGDIVLHDYLMSIGLTPNKSLTIGALNIPREYFFDYLRGSFDGDGCFYSYFDPRWKNSYMFYLALVSGSIVHLEWIQSMTKEYAGCQGCISKHTGRV